MKNPSSSFRKKQSRKNLPERFRFRKTSLPMADRRMADRHTVNRRTKNRHTADLRMVPVPRSGQNRKVNSRLRTGSFRKRKFLKLTAFQMELPNQKQLLCEKMPGMCPLHIPALFILIQNANDPQKKMPAGIFRLIT